MMRILINLYQLTVAQIGKSGIGSCMAYYTGYLGRKHLQVDPEVPGCHFFTKLIISKASTCGSHAGTLSYIASYIADRITQ